MFTFGIFTTHFPYIMFVVFYAWFLLFGVGKAMSGEIDTGEKYCQTEWVTEKHYNSHDFNSASFRDINPGDFKNTVFEKFHFKKRLAYAECTFPVHLPDYYCSSLFCRPPPSVV
ncbi:MAG: hypothetical protein FD181_384 [Prolixibacteraceae bacterium]|nr:MAG: hypothetical protein FD181_384 [Prolixibacteraceae bacterium]